MSPRETLYQLIDQLPEEDLSTAKRILQALSASAVPHVSLDEAPLDDEPDDDDFDGGLTEARADAAAGRVVPHEEMKRRWGLR
jgi:predicted transcriptional regulator